MTRNDFIIKTIIAMAANSAYKFNWIGGHDWAITLIQGATELADHMEKRQLSTSHESDGDG